jgi:hypothetical protein
MFAPLLSPLLSTQLWHGKCAFQHLISLSEAPSNKRGRHAAYFPGLFSYEEGEGVARGWAELGCACLSEDPSARPTFGEVLKVRACGRGFFSQVV